MARTFLQHLRIHQYELPRQFFTTTVNEPVLHVFANASIKAYGAVADLCADTQPSFIIVRTRVAPLKTQTLPRLELMAATIAKTLANFICSSLNSTYECLSVHCRAIAKLSSTG